MTRIKQLFYFIHVSESGTHWQICNYIMWTNKVCSEETNVEMGQTEGELGEEDLQDLTQYSGVN